MTTTLLVSVELDGMPVEAGVAHVSWHRGVVSATFRYADAYLARPGAYPLDPAMPLLTGAHQSQGLPGAFQDCSPDRWGRTLIEKRIRSRAATDRVTPASVGEVDHLLGVSDISRQGNLRFRTAEGGPFLGADASVPQLIELPRLLRAADAVSREGDGPEFAAVKELLDAGSGSLGGARPKASVRDGDDLMIAKFPHPGDDWDVMVWEKVALDLARAAGIDVPESRLVRVEGRAVLLLRRFDRVGLTRVGYLSAMTMVGARDGDVHDYIDIAEALQENGSDARRDLRQLWRRMAFSVAINNTDDHLRNHGFLRDGNGWRLSPAFDVNPNPDVATSRVTGIGGARRRSDALAGLLSVAELFDTSADEGQQTVQRVLGATSSWRQVAQQAGIRSSECARFEAAFDGHRSVLSAGFSR